MKKILFAAAAVFALFSCNTALVEAPKPDVVELTPRSLTFGELGGSADVSVVSNAAWTLEAAESYTWVTTSRAEGQDGDVVTFTVEPNNTEDVVATFTFKSGEASTSFLVFSYASEPPVFELKSDATLSLGYETELVEILVATNKNHYRDVEYQLSEGAAEWLTYRATLPGETEADAKVYFEAKALAGLEDRSATITLSAPGLAPVEVSVTQYAKHVLSTPSNRYTIAVEGETINIPLTANVAYEMTMEGAEGWLTAGAATADGIPFTATALAEGKRSATVTFTQTDAAEGETPLVNEVIITQVNAIVHWAVDMRGNRLFPKWDGVGGGVGTLTNFTLESLVYIEEFPATQTLATLMGIEGQCLLRFGDSGVPLNHLQIATSGGNYELTSVNFEAKRWYHIAVVFTLPTATVYVDGVKVGESQKFQTGHYSWNKKDLTSVNLSPSWSYETNGAARAFWMGYAYDQNRPLPGYMTEMRIWNRALTAEEIAADDHFYEVDPASEGLFSYWKVIAGEGNSIPDATANGNALYGELNIQKDAATDANKGTDGITYVSVSLPDR